MGHGEFPVAWWLSHNHSDIFAFLLFSLFSLGLKFIVYFLFNMVGQHKNESAELVYH